MVEPSNFHNHKKSPATDMIINSVPPPPSSPPFLYRQNATWDDESREKEKIRVEQVIKVLKEKKMQNRL